MFGKLFIQLWVHIYASVKAESIVKNKTGDWFYRKVSVLEAPLNCIIESQTNKGNWLDPDITISSNNNFGSLTWNRRGVYVTIGGGVDARHIVALISTMKMLWLVHHTKHSPWRKGWGATMLLAATFLMPQQYNWQALGKNQILLVMTILFFIVVAWVDSCYIWLPAWKQSTAAK